MSSPILSSTASIAASRQEWLSQREILRQKEKQFSKLKDEITRERRQLPWLPLEQDFALENCSVNTKPGDAKNATKLSQIFGSHRQLLVYNCMSFDAEKGYPCGACTLLIEQLCAVYDHLSKNTAVAVLCHGPPDRLRIWAKLRGWKVPVYACGEDECKFVMSEGTPDGYGNPKSRPTLSAFVKGGPDGSNPEQLYLGYATWQRGVEEIEVVCNYMDRTPLEVKGARRPGMLDWRATYGEPAELPANFGNSCHC